jgi:hypothetical protein
MNCGEIQQPKKPSGVTRTALFAAEKFGTSQTTATSNVGRSSQRMSIRKG